MNEYQNTNKWGRTNSSHNYVEEKKIERVVSFRILSHTEFESSSDLIDYEQIRTRKARHILRALNDQYPRRLYSELTRVSAPRVTTHPTFTGWQCRLSSFHSNQQRAYVRTYSACSKIFPRNTSCYTLSFSTKGLVVVETDFRLPRSKQYSAAVTIMSLSPYKLKTSALT